MTSPSARTRGIFASVALSLVVAGVGCMRPYDGDANSPDDAAPAQPTQPGAAQPGQYAPPAQPTPYAQSQPPPYAQPAPYAPPAQPAPYSRPAPYAQPAPAVVPAGPARRGDANDPINTLDQNWMRGQASSVLVELINALPQAQASKVREIPLNADPSVGEINAFAACENGQPLMAVSDGLLQVEAYTAQFRATDEIYGTHKLGQYMNHFLRAQQPHQPIVAPPAGLIEPAQQMDARKIARQHVLFEEQLAFVLGHELAHHWLGHTGCANGQRGVLFDPNRANRVASVIVPSFNQVNELAADTEGTRNLLGAGAKREGAHWNEEGALLTLGFFERLEGAPNLLALLHSHPPAGIRRIAVQTGVSQYRSGWQMPVIPGLFGG
jgi:hypothetical protein